MVRRAGLVVRPNLDAAENGAEIAIFKRAGEGGPTGSLASDPLFGVAYWIR
jgi:hypothetical protein